MLSNYPVAVCVSHGANAYLGNTQHWTLHANYGACFVNGIPRAAFPQQGAAICNPDASTQSHSNPVLANASRISLFTYRRAHVFRVSFVRRSLGVDVGLWTVGHNGFSGLHLIWQQGTGWCPYIYWNRNRLRRRMLETSRAGIVAQLWQLLLLLLPFGHVNISLSLFMCVPALLGRWLKLADERRAWRVSYLLHRKHLRMPRLNDRILCMTCSCGNVRKMC